MPLSDHEQKLLEQMERALYAEDPKFATQMKGSAGPGTPRRRAIIGLTAAVVVLAVVVVGVTTELIVVGGLGFALMVAGVAWALTPSRSSATVGVVGADGSINQVRPTGRRAPARGKSKPSGKRGNFLQRLEERWEKRRRDEW